MANLKQWMDAVQRFADRTNAIHEALRDYVAILEARLEALERRMDEYDKEEE